MKSLRKAFPGTFPDDTNCNPGMTLREWYAGLALQGLLSENATDLTYRGIDSDAIELADLMLEELER